MADLWPLYESEHRKQLIITSELLKRSK